MNFHPWQAISPPKQLLCHQHQQDWDVRTGTARTDFRTFFERSECNGHCQEIRECCAPSHHLQDCEGLQGEWQDSAEAEQSQADHQDCHQGEEDEGEDLTWSKMEHAEDGQGQGRVKDDQVEGVPAGPRDDSLQKAETASPLGRQKGQVFAPRSPAP